jgi:hypothetical protein
LQSDASTVDAVGHGSPPNDGAMQDRERVMTPPPQDREQEENEDHSDNLHEPGVVQ